MVAMSLLERYSAAPSADSLNKWNKWLAAIYALQAVLLLALSSSSSVPISISYLTADNLQTALTGSTVQVAASHVLFEMNVVFLVAAFLLVSGLAHVIMASYNRYRYEQELNAGLNRVRWIGLAVSGGLMVVTLAALCGVYDIVTLVLLFAMTAAAFLLGLFIEIINPLRNREPKLGLLVLACLLGVIPWLAIEAVLLAGQLYGSGSVASALIWTAPVTFLLTAMMPAALYLQQRKRGPFKNYTFAERKYALLAFVTQTLLAWLLYFGVFHP
jgi:hypothetical protein